MMRRREFITLIGGAAAAWPLAARAQQRAQPMRRVGWLTAFAEDDPEGTARIAAFRQTLADLGLARGRLSQRGVIATAFSVLEFCRGHI
jgi:putative ABC transport system substrate-binding protein